MRIFKILLLGLIIQSCSGEKNNENSSINNNIDTTSNAQTDSIIVEEPIIEEPVYIVDSLEQRLIDSGLVNIQDVIPGILADVRYSDTNNFMKTDVYGNLNRIYLQASVAEDLKKCQEKLKEIRIDIFSNF